MAKELSGRNFIHTYVFDIYHPIVISFVLTKVGEAFDDERCPYMSLHRSGLNAWAKAILLLNTLQEVTTYSVQDNVCVNHHVPFFKSG